MRYRIGGGVVRMHLHTSMLILVLVVLVVGNCAYSLVLCLVCSHTHTCT